MNRLFIMELMQIKLRDLAILKEARAARKDVKSFLPLLPEAKFHVLLYLMICSKKDAKYSVNPEGSFQWLSDTVLGLMQIYPFLSWWQ